MRNYEVDPFAIPGGSPLSVDDARVPYAELDRRVPLLTRVPDWRVLLLHRCLWTRYAIPVCLETMSIEEVEAQLAVIDEQMHALHEQAGQDERAASSSALRWAFEVLGVAFIDETPAREWIESTPLLCAIRRRLEAPW